MRLVVADRSPYGWAADATTDSVICAVARKLGADAEAVTFESVSDPALAAIGTGDVVLVRADLRTDQDLRRVTDAVWTLERRGVRCLPGSESLVAAEDKLRSFVRLRSAGVDTPSFVAMCPSARLHDVAEFQSRMLAFPVVVKRPVGWGGHGTEVCRDAAEFRALLERDARERDEGVVLVQPFLTHDRVVTVAVVDGVALCASGWRPAPGEFRSNAAFGGIREDAALTPEIEAAALASVAACGLSFGTVDLLDFGDGSFQVIDVNAVPRIDPDDPGDLAFSVAIVRSALGAG